MSKLRVEIKTFWTEDSKNNSPFKVYRDQLDVPENCKSVKGPLNNDDILKNKNIHYCYKKMTKNMQICSSFSHKPVLL